MSVISKERFATGFQWTAYMQDSAKNIERFHENHDDLLDVYIMDLDSINIKLIYTIGLDLKLIRCI